jgi:hypothetical protein
MNKRFPLSLLASISLAMAVAPTVAPPDLSIWPPGWYAPPPFEQPDEPADRPEPVWLPVSLTYASGSPAPSSLTWWPNLPRGQRDF